MPEFDVPGHGSWGAGRPELMGCADVLDPTKPEVYDFLKAFLGEMAAVFEDEFFFLGGDEVNTTCWDDNPGIAKWMKQRGLNSTQLFSYFWNRTSAEVLPALGKKVGVWAAKHLQRPHRVETLLHPVRWLLLLRCWPLLLALATS